MALIEMLVSCGSTLEMVSGGLVSLEASVGLFSIVALIVGAVPKRSIGYS